MKQVLVVLICLGVFTLTSSGAPTRVLSNCCNRYSKIIPKLDKIQDYKLQIKDGRCNKNAVIFIKVTGRRVCAKPNNEQVKERMKSLSKRKQRE
ncbi:monocyte chemotactic protein 1B-like [Pristis pectinata]|uniref:monocyte chemotactic protein 1B-like n=1 Tax=Pristis pectinata TaxID=685728 RepID=UPI00223D98A6|nr:monocyte chemotactic protein 1B-like [Pristis pectinata]